MAQGRACLPSHYIGSTRIWEIPPKILGFTVSNSRKSQFQQTPNRAKFGWKFRLEKNKRCKDPRNPQYKNSLLPYFTVEMTFSYACLSHTHEFEFIPPQVLRELSFFFAIMSCHSISQLYLAPVPGPSSTFSHPCTVLVHADMSAIPYSTCKAAERSHNRGGIAILGR